MDAGFVVTHDESLLGADRWRAAGPFWERREATNGASFFALRPFMSVAADPDASTTITDFLWPLGSKRDSHGQSTWRFLTAYGNDFDVTNAHSRFRSVVFPFVFSGRDKQGERYFAIFPLGGSVHEYLGRDRATFVLFPLYAYSTINGVDSHTLIWPIGAWTSGRGVRRFKIWPLYGRSVTRDEVVKTFALWPLWTSVRYRSPAASGNGFVLFPLVGRVNMSNQQTWMFLPPFFRWSTAGTRRAWNAPWPFFQYRSGGDQEKLFFWPLWGRNSMVLSGGKPGEDGVSLGFPFDGADGGPEPAEAAYVRSSFFLWPIVRSQERSDRRATTKRLMVLPLVFSETEVKRPAAAGVIAQDSVGREGTNRLEVAAAAAGGGDKARGGQGGRDGPSAGATNGLSPAVTNRYFKLYPLMSYRKEGDAVRVRTLDLWPLKNTAGVEKNLAPLWTLYSHSRIGGRAEDELLWGLWRRRQDGGGYRRWSLFPLASWEREPEQDACAGSILMGLAGYEREGLRKRFRVLYFLKLGSLGDDNP